MQSFRPENSIIVFDIHGVLVKTDYIKALRLLRSRQTFTILKYLCNPKVLWELVCLARKGAIAEEYFVYFTSRYEQLAGCKELLLAVANAQRPIQPMFDLVHELKSRGYTLHILSNIGELMYFQLYPRFSNLFDQFDKVKIANPGENYISKPNPQMYELYFKQCNPDNKRVIFIDDKPKNLRAAHKAGMVCVHFSCTRTFIRKLSKIIQRVPQQM